MHMKFKIYSRSATDAGYKTCSFLLSNKRGKIILDKISQHEFSYTLSDPIKTQETKSHSGYLVSYLLFLNFVDNGRYDSSNVNSRTSTDDSVL